MTPSLEAGGKIDATVNMRFVKPIDEAIVLQCAIEHDLIVTVEENIAGGAWGSACAKCYPGNLIPQKNWLTSLTIWVYRQTY